MLTDHSLFQIKVQSIEKLNELFKQAILDGNLNLFMELWSHKHDVYCINPGSKRYKGYHAISVAWEQILETAPSSINTKNSIEMIHGDVIINMSLEILEFKFNNQTFTDLYHVTKIIVRQDDKLSLIACHLSEAPTDDLRNNTSFQWLN